MLIFLCYYYNTQIDKENKWESIKQYHTNINFQLWFIIHLFCSFVWPVSIPAVIIALLLLNSFA